MKGMSKRIETLDVLRGVALCGIAFVNVFPIIGFVPMGKVNQVHEFLQLFVQERFFPIFSLLFGIGFGMMFLAAQRRAANPRRVMFRRILGLAVLGAFHQLIHPGEALLPYAIVAIILLFPATFVPRVWVRALAVPFGLALIFVGGFFGGLAVIPGVFLLGFGLAFMDIPRRVDYAGRWVWPSLVVLIGISAIAVWQQTLLPVEKSQSAQVSLTGLLLAATYCLAVIAIMSTSLRLVFVRIFSPLGKMALSNYILSSLVFQAFLLAPYISSRAVENNGSTQADWLVVVILVAVMLAVQALVSAVWIRHVGQGPLEKLWRIATWKGEVVHGTTEDRTRTP